MAIAIDQLLTTLYSLLSKLKYFSFSKILAIFVGCKFIGYEEQEYKWQRFYGKGVTTSRQEFCCHCANFNNGHNDS
jgi:hypothetical protein